MDSVPGFVGKKTEILREQLRCAICLEVYRRPRSLACLHCFCEGCLESVFRRNTDKFVEKKEIECPVCHTGTAAPAGATTFEEWAKSLPMDSIVSPLPHDTLTESESTRMCGHCAAAEEIVDAVSYCLECNDLLCQKCTRIHTRVSVSKQHKVSNLSDMSSSQTAAGQIRVGMEFCRIHPNEHIKFFCQEHSFLCCGTCAFVHRKCEQVIEVHKLGHSMKQKGQAQQLKSNMEAFQNNLAGYTDILETNVAEILDDTTSIKQTLKEMRDALVQKIDQFVRDVSKKADILRDDHHTTLTEKISEQKSLTAAITTSLFMLESVLKNGSETQIFIAVHKIEEQLRRYINLLQEDQESSTTVHLQLKTSDLLDAFINTTDNLVNIKVQQRKIESPVSGIPDAQHHVEDHISSDVVEVEGSLGHMTLIPCASNNMPPIVDCRVEEVAIVDVVKRKGNTHIPFVKDITYLHDGSLVYVDANNELCCLMDDTYTVVAFVKLPNTPLGMVVTTDSELVVATLCKALHVLSVHNNTLTLTRTIPCNRQPRCLAKVSETDLMVGWDGEGVGVISLTDGREKTYLAHDTSGAKIEINDNDYITVDNNRSRIYFTQGNQQYTLRCISLDGAPTFDFTDDQLKGTAGVALDRDGNVYVCGYLSNNILQISPNGVPIRTIDLGTKWPYTICFNNTGDQIAVANSGYGELRKLYVMRFALPI